MAQEKFLTKERLPEWIAALGRHGKVLVPCQEREAVVFRPYAAGDGRTTLADSTASPKAVIFPACQELFRFEQTKDPENPEKTTLELFPITAISPCSTTPARRWTWPSRPNCPNGSPTPVCPRRSLSMSHRPAGSIRSG